MIPIGSSPLRLRRAGFTFLEVLFAVIIIGIGFIMIAAMFPVAIQQTQATVAESLAQNVARDALHYLQGNATNANFPVTYDAAASTFQCVPVLPAVYGNSIATGDSRFGWLAFYRRDYDASTGLPSAYAQVIVVVAKQQASGQTVFSSALNYTLTNSSLFQAAFNSGLSGTTVTFTASTSPANAPPGPLTDNAYVVVLRSAVPDLVGRVARLGTNVARDPSNGYVWNLQPGALDQNSSGNEVFVLGSPIDPEITRQTGTNTFSGLAQEVSVVTGIIHIEN